MSYAIKLENFEGPLDLLLHLIKKNEMDIYDIPIADITAQYLGLLDAMKSLNLEVAGEFLVMAATLLHIKSRMLLPPTEEEEPEEEDDPRAELVRRLLEYQKFKDAAESLDRLPLLGRDVFARKFADPGLAAAEEEETASEIGLFELVDAFRSLLQEVNREETFHEITHERLSVTERVNHLLDLLQRKKRLMFREIFSARPDRHEVVVSFLAMLELVKMKAIHMVQEVGFGPIWLYPAQLETSAEQILPDEGALGYGGY